MRESDFEMFLTNDTSITSKDKAVRSRMSKARSVEMKLEINFDDVVRDDELMYKTLLRIQNELGDSNGAKQNALRKYYIFANGRKFPTIKSYLSSTR